MPEQSSVIYLNTVVSLNEGWDALNQAYREFDPLVHHIRCFERILSPNLPEMIESNPKYKEVNEKFPLPDDRQEIPMESFRAWISAFENVMREHGIIGRKSSGDKEMRDPLAAFFEVRS
jgi:hypothetical protein